MCYAQINTQLRIISKGHSVQNKKITTANISIVLVTNVNINNLFCVSRYEALLDLLIHQKVI